MLETLLSHLKPYVAHFTLYLDGPWPFVKERKNKKKKKTNHIQQACNNFVCFVCLFSQGTSLAEAANTVFVSAKQSMSSGPDSRTGKEN